MPVGAYTKDEVRQIAEEIGLLVANKPDSQDICFVSDDDYGELLSKRRLEPEDSKREICSIQKAMILGRA